VWGLMASINVTAQEMDDGLEEMWTESKDGINSINPGKFIFLGYSL
jgi:hypothetical protein